MIILVVAVTDTMCKTEPFSMARSQKLEGLYEPIGRVLWNKDTFGISRGRNNRFEEALSLNFAKKKKEERYS